MAKKTRIDDIDSAAVINSFRLDDTSLPLEARSTESSRQPKTKEPGQQTATSATSTKKGMDGNGKPDYESTFVCESNVTARLGKQVYIKKEFHDRIQKILHVVGGNEVTIASYLNNVLTYHFEQCQDDIVEAFNRHLKSYNL